LGLGNLIGLKNKIKIDWFKVQDW